jgi:hypothetical protein
MQRTRTAPTRSSKERAVGMMNPRLACAYHEVGHALVAMLCGYKVASLELFGTWDKPVNGLQGITRYSGRPECPTAYADIAVTLAGPIAESVFCARDLLEVLREGERFERSDLWRARREAERLHRLRLYRSPDHALLIAENRGRLMLEEHWHLVAKSAQALYEQGRIE